MLVEFVVDFVEVDGDSILPLLGIGVWCRVVMVACVWRKTNEKKKGKPKKKEKGSLSEKKKKKRGKEKKRMGVS